MKKNLKLAFALSAIVATAAAGYSVYRNMKIDQLYAEAARYPPYFRNTEGARVAVSKLATYKGRHTSALLLEIATGRQTVPFTDIRTEAIKALAQSDDPSIPAEIASLIQPHEGLDVRKAAAQALNHLTCKGECLRMILQYLDRVWRGEPNYEDLLTNPTHSDTVIASVKGDQAQIYSALYTVLKRESPETLSILIHVYGIASGNPSLFGLDLLGRLHLQQACTYLLQSQSEAKDIRPEFYKFPRKELQETISSLNCESPAP